MNLTCDEQKGIPISQEIGRARTIQRIVLGYASPTSRSMAKANSSRFYLFRTEGQGFKGALSHSHNLARTPNKTLMIPRREVEQAEQKRLKEKNRERKEAILCLKYGKKFNTLTFTTLEKCRTAGIRIKDNSLYPLDSHKIYGMVSERIRSAMKG